MGEDVLPGMVPVIEWIDRELMDAYGVARGRGGDTLLRLRGIFSGKSLNGAVGGFYRLLPRLERNHFLLSYRLRRWISVSYEVAVTDPLERVAESRLAIRPCDRDLGGFREGFAGDVAGDLRVRVVVR